LDRALAFEARGCRFKPCRAYTPSFQQPGIRTRLQLLYEELDWLTQLRRQAAPSHTEIRKLSVILKAFCGVIHFCKAMNVPDLPCVLEARLCHDWIKQLTCWAIVLLDDWLISRCGCEVLPDPFNAHVRWRWFAKARLLLSKG
jgi:hypothetical protein